MFSRAITRSTFTRRSDTEEVDRAAQPLLEVDGGPVAEPPLGLADVGPRIADLAGPRVLVALLDGPAEDAPDRLRKVVHAGGSAGGDVEDPAARAFGLACPDGRVGRRLLGDGQVAARAVDRRARGEDDPADALVARREQHVQRALDVDGARGQRVLDRARHRAERAQVKDGLDAADGVVDALVASQLALDDLDVDA